MLVSRRGCGLVTRASNNYNYVNVDIPVPLRSGAYEHVRKAPKSEVKYVNVSDTAPDVVVDVDTNDYASYDYEAAAQRREFKYYAEIASLVLQFSISGLFFLMVYMSFKNRGGSGPGGFLSNPGKEYEVQSDDVTNKVTFADVAGLEGAKEELKEIVDFLKTPEKYARLGAKIPKGCLLTGGPGLGKTLISKAVAGEAGVPFFSCSAAEFIELFVGVGASRIRNIFKKAKEKAPCIIFIDEIDAIGRARSSGNAMGNNDEREQTINQLLTEMDGFENNRGIVVIAATNRPDILDPALVRPGRFDRQIALELPSKKARQEILSVHARDKPFADCVNANMEDVAAITAGFSGADLANLMNESAILAARLGKEKIEFEDIEHALDRILLGLHHKDVIVSKEKRRLTAYHEAGHALVALKIGEFDTIKKVSIVPRGKTGGVTMFEQDANEGGLYSKRYLENQLAVALGGRVAEELVVGQGDITTGASGDLERVQQIARAMVMKYGFSERIGHVSWSPSQSGGHSETTAYEIDCEVRELAQVAYKRASNIINNNTDLLRRIADKLLECEVISGAEIKELAATNVKRILDLNEM